MMTIWTKKSAFDVLLDVTGGYKAGTCREDDRWYRKHDVLSLRNFIIASTLYLDTYSTTYRLRMLCFKFGLVEAPVCMFCDDLCYAEYGVGRLRRICQSAECKRKQKSLASKEMHANMLEGARLLKNAKIGAANRGLLEARHSPERAAEIRSNVGKASTGRVQSEETKGRRIVTRRMNNEKTGRPWHADETKAKIKETNRIVHSDPRYEVEHADARVRSRATQSKTMKRKIMLGEFTPNSSNYRTVKKITIIVDGEERSFRSSWEAAYYCVWFHATGEKLQYEVMRVPYEHNGIEHVYIVDFLTAGGDLVEIRPRARQVAAKERAKFDAARALLASCGKIFTIIDEEWFVSNAALVKSVISAQRAVRSKLERLLQHVHA